MPSFAIFLLKASLLPSKLVLPVRVILAVDVVSSANFVNLLISTTSSLTRIKFPLTLTLPFSPTVSLEESMVNLFYEVKVQS